MPSSKLSKICMDHVDGWPFQVVSSVSETIFRGSEVPMSCLSLQISGNFSLLARPANFSKYFRKHRPSPRPGAACSLHASRCLCHSRDTRQIWQRLLAHAPARAARHHVPRRRCCSCKQRCSVTAVNARIDAARPFCCSERGGWSSLDHPPSAERTRTF